MQPSSHWFLEHFQHPQKKPIPVSRHSSLPDAWVLSGLSRAPFSLEPCNFGVFSDFCRWLYYVSRNASIYSGVDPRHQSILSEVGHHGLLIAQSNQRFSVLVFPLRSIGHFFFGDAPVSLGCFEVSLSSSPLVRSFCLSLLSGSILFKYGCSRRSSSSNAGYAHPFIFSRDVIFK